MADAVITQFWFSFWQTNCIVHIMFLGALTQHATSSWSCVLHTEWRRRHPRALFNNSQSCLLLLQGKELSPCRWQDRTEKSVRLSRHLRKYIHFLTRSPNKSTGHFTGCELSQKELPSLWRLLHVRIIYRYRQM